MSEYTPEKVAELIAGAERAWEAAGHIPQGTMVHETQWLPFANLYSVAESLLDALTAVSAERDEAWRVTSEQTRLERDRAESSEADRDRLHKAITEALDLTRPGASVPLGVSEVRHIDRLMATTHRILRAALDKEGNDDE